MLDFALESMIQQQLVSRGIRNQDVIRAFRAIDRKIFVPDYLHHHAYADEVLPIGLGQTISSPFVVGTMLQQLDLKPGARVLEVGTGTGFETALLSRLAGTVYAVEIQPELSARARKVLVDDLGIDNVHFRVADGFQGWSDAAPFDGIIVTCAAEEVPWPLIGQLRGGCRLVMPVGSDKEQALHIVSKDESGETDERIIDAEHFGALFPLMVGEAQE